MMFWYRLITCLLVVGVCRTYASDQYGTADVIPTTRQSRAETNISLPETPKKLKRITSIFFAYNREADVDNETEVCTDSMDDFPPFFTKEQLKQGAFLCSIVVGLYCFTLLAIVCDDYFLPSVKRICKVLNLSEDVAAATFMSVATSCPEMFTNIIGTFITKSDIGIGTVVGSSMYNTLGVAAIGGLFAPSPIQIEWFPVTRDVSIYIIAIVLLVVMIWDSMIFWYEALVLFIVYFIYFTIMFQNPRISKFIMGLIKSNKVEAMDSDKPPPGDNISVIVVPEIQDEPVQKYVESKEDLVKAEKVDEEEEYSLWRAPKGKWYKRVFFYYSWPIKLILTCTIPDPVTYPKLFPLTFILCIFWIGTNSYMVSWMLTIIGYVFGIPDVVLGFTFLAAGSGLPESISMALVASKGEGGMGVSNALGANTMNILLSLGMPWFLKCVSMGFNDQSFIQIESGSIEYTILSLTLVATCLYVTLYFCKFQLSKKLGGILLSIYSVFIVLAILTETVFFPTDSCDSLS